MKKYTVVLSHRYKKSLKRWYRNKDFNEKLLKEVINFLADGEALASKHKDHQLQGFFKQYRECHVQNDLLLVYQKQNDVLILLLVDIGSHSELFG